MGRTITSRCVARSITSTGIAFLLAGFAGAQVTTRISLDLSGQLPNDDAFAPAVSADGQTVAFQWYAAFTDSDIFLRVPETGELERISVSSNGVAGNSYCYGAAPTPDAQLVAFSSYSSNLVAGDTNGPYPNGHDVFLRDRANGTTERVSLGDAGQQGNDASYSPAISADGRYVAFTSHSDNFIAADTNGVEDVFLRDRVAGTTELISVDSAGVLGNDQSACTAISADGRYVLFHGAASNLVTGDTNGSVDVFLRDRMAGTTVRVSVASSGAEGNANSDSAALSPDGRYVVFRSSATNLVPGDTNGKSDAFLHDRATGMTERISIDSAETQSDGDTWQPVVTPDGRFVAFQSRATNLVAGDSNDRWDVFVRDRLLGTTERVSVDSNGLQGTADSGIMGPAISTDGRYVAFDSRAQLDPTDTDNWHDIYLRDRGPQAPSPYCTSGTTANGCSAAISATGTASASAASGFDVEVNSVEGGKPGILFWGLSSTAIPWGGGTSWLCIAAPTVRTGVQSSGGTAGACDGAYSLDFNAWLTANPSQAPAAGTTVHMQAWFRDPPSPMTTSLSDALVFTLVP